MPSLSTKERNVKFNTDGLIFRKSLIYLAILTLNTALPVSLEGCKKSFSIKSNSIIRISISVNIYDFS